jgi:UMP-CMP kinase
MSAPTEDNRSFKPSQPAPHVYKALLIQRFKVIFILGGPGSGKSEYCALLAYNYRIWHLSISDTLQAEMHRQNSKYGQAIRKCIKEETVVPTDITIALLKADMLAAAEKLKIYTFVVGGRLIFSPTGSSFCFTKTEEEE